MPKEEWHENSVDKIFKKAGLWPWSEGDIVSILDVGCGLALKSKFVPTQIRVGVDIFEGFLDRIESDVPYVPIRWDVRRLTEIFLDNSFDLVLALDVIEHFVKEDALAVISQCERIARRAVILQTPKGFMHQNIDIFGCGAHEYETHRSGWEPEELESLGYQCFLRDHKLSDVKRHTDIEYTDLNIKQIDAIKFISKGGRQ